MRLFWAAVVLVSCCACAMAQVCRLSVAGVNRARRVMGPVHAECPEGVLHTVPFGNWGVSSNYGHKTNGRQFDGWCHEAQVCDNSGFCKKDCIDGWYEWNSCTDHPLYSPPNCSLYNSTDCTEQATTTGINVHGTKYVDLPVSCPTDTNGDGVADAGGCGDLKAYASDQNFMSLYELDPICCDDLIQTVYFPQTVVELACDAFGCAPAGSNWVTPSFYSSPPAPAKVSAELATIVNWGAFVDNNRSCRVTASAIRGVSAASLTGPNLAPQSIAAVFGDNLSSVILEAAEAPLPTSLGGTTVQVTDRAGFSRLAPLFYVSPGQINFQVPPATAVGSATISVYRGDILRASGRVQIEAVAPGIFTQNASGEGVPAGVLLRFADDTWSTEPLSTCGSEPGSCVPRPLDLGPPGSVNYLVLYGTGIRNRADLSGVAMTIGGEHVTVEYVGPQDEHAGLDQLNVRLPDELRGRGEVDVLLTVDGKPANTVRLNFQ